MALYLTSAVTVILLFTTSETTAYQGHPKYIAYSYSIELQNKSCMLYHTDSI